MTEPQAHPQSRSPALTGILATTRDRVARLRPLRAELERAAAHAGQVPGWLAPPPQREVAVVAEIKRRSPSAGAIAPALDPAAHARAYADGGAAALSVLTDERHFGGSLADLETVRRAVDLPVLRKDFIIDPVQVFETRAAGASAVLLIVRILGEETLHELAALAADLGLTRLVEVHASGELERAVAVSPECIGVNARDLDTFSLHVEATGRVLRRVPGSAVAVAESGIRERRDVERVAGEGADAILVGTALAGAPDPAAAVRGLIGVRRRGRRTAGEPR